MSEKPATARPPFREQIAPLLPYVGRHRKGIWLGVGAMLAENALGAAFPLVLAKTIDTVLTGTTLNVLLLFAGSLLAIQALKSVLLYYKRWILIMISRDIEYDLRQNLYEHLQRQSARFYSEWRVGDLMSRATNDLNAVRMMAGPAFMYVTNAVAAFAFAIAAMLYLDWPLTLMLLIPVPIVAFIVSYFGRKIHHRFERIQSKLADLTAQVQENIAGARLVRAFTQEEAEQERFAETNREFIRRNRSLIKVQAMFWPTLEALVMVAFLFVLILGGRAVLAERISVGGFLAFMQYMFILTWPMIALGWVVNIIERGLASLERLNVLLAAEPEVKDRPQPNAPTDIRGEIEFRNLSFRYNGTPILSDINLRIAAGETLAIVGPTASGKTTLTNLIGRLYDPPESSLLIDGRPVTDYRLETLRQSIGYVPQESFLFSDTLRGNIALGRPEASDDEIAEAASVAGLSDDISDFPLGYATRVGERGITLSGGQKQRTAIARAVLRDPKILILDDALSSVDTVTEERILRHLKEVMSDRTSIIISHRVSTVKHADQIVVLHEGRIVEQGTHDELLSRQGYYNELYEKQLLEEELERE